MRGQHPLCIALGPPYVWGSGMASADDCRCQRVAKESSVHPQSQDWGAARPVSVVRPGSSTLQVQLVGSDAGWDGIGALAQERKPLYRHLRCPYLGA